MNRQDFIAGLGEELELEMKLEESTDLKKLEEWDSMAAMILIGYVSTNFGLTLNSDDISQITTVHSLIEKIGVDKFD